MREPAPVKAVWPTRFEGSEQILFEGRSLTVDFSSDSSLQKIRIEEDFGPIRRLRVRSNPQKHSKAKVQKALLSFFKLKMEARLRGLLTQYLPRIARQPGAIRIRPFKSQWGSCHPNGTVRLNFNLIFTPPETLEYVLVHELAHLKHMNHSKSFWRHVGELLPDYARRSKLLHEYSAVLYWQKVPKIDVRA